MVQTMLYLFSFFTHHGVATVPTCVVVLLIMVATVPTWVVALIVMVARCPPLERIELTMEPSLMLSRLITVTWKLTLVGFPEINYGLVL